MKITKSELKEMIREVLREELKSCTTSKLEESVWTCFFDEREVGTVEAATESEAKEKMMDKYPEYPYGLYDGCFWVEPLTEAAISGGQAEGGFLDTAKRPGASISKNKFNALEGKKTKKVLAKDLKPGMITNTGEVKQVTDRGNGIEVSYGGVGNRGSYASDNVAKNYEYEVLDKGIEEELESIFEGIFDSKETKQKAYAKIIADAFDKKAPAAIASQIASLADRALGETIDSFDETNVSSAKTAAKNFIIAINSAKAAAKKTPYGMLTSIISYVQKYNRNAIGLDELVGFKRTALHVQSHEKDGQKAMYYLMELVNKQLATRLDKTIAFLKKEYSI